MKYPYRTGELIRVELQTKNKYKLIRTSGRFNFTSISAVFA